MKAWTYCIALSLVCCSCLSQQKHTAISGTYTTCKPGILEQVRIERRFGGPIYPLPAALIYFRSDRTYVMGFCDNQVRETGRYAYKGDSVRLYERYNLEEKTNVQERTMYFDSEDGLLYFITPDPKSTHKKRPYKVLPLKKDHHYAHVGFLRGQEMGFDSLRQYYQQRPVADQNSWTDSVLNALQSKQP